MYTRNGIMPNLRSAVMLENVSTKIKHSLKLYQTFTFSWLRAIVYVVFAPDHIQAGG